MSAASIEFPIDAEREFAFVVRSRGDLERHAEGIAAAQLELNRLLASKSEELRAVQERFAKQIQVWEKAIGQRLEACFEFCRRNEATEFHEGRTLDLGGATLQFKVCPPAVKEADGWTPKLIFEALRRWRKWRQYVRVKFELNRRAIAEDREKFTPRQWAKRGLVIIQGRSLIVTAKGDPEVMASLTR